MIADSCDRRAAVDSRSDEAWSVDARGRPAMSSTISNDEFARLSSESTASWSQREWGSVRERGVAWRGVGTCAWQIGTRPEQHAWQANLMVWGASSNAWYAAYRGALPGALPLQDARAHLVREVRRQVGHPLRRYRHDCRSVGGGGRVVPRRDGVGHVPTRHGIVVVVVVVDLLEASGVDQPKRLHLLLRREIVHRLEAAAARVVVGRRGLLRQGELLVQAGVVHEAEDLVLGQAGEDDLIRVRVGGGLVGWCR